MNYNYELTAGLWLTVSVNGLSDPMSTGLLGS